MFYVIAHILLAFEVKTIIVRFLKKKGRKDVCMWCGSGDAKERINSDIMQVY